MGKFLLNTMKKFHQKFFTVTEKLQKSENILLSYDVNGHVYSKLKSVKLPALKIRLTLVID